MPRRRSPDVEAIAGGTHGDPFAFLGMHKTSVGLYVRAMLPDAEAMSVVDAASGTVAAQGERIHPAGVFAARMPERKEPFRYRLRVSWGGYWHEFDDAYRFGPVLGELDIHLLIEGNHLASYQKLGAHPIRHEGVEGVAFAVWAPNARRVSVVGDFNSWDGRRMPMRKILGGGFWEIFVPGLRPGQVYKYELLGPHGELLPLKADPHAEQAERPPGTASVVAAPSRHVWQDDRWMAERARHNDREAPISIYEVHLGSWSRNVDEGFRYLTYREMADELVPYVADLGFTHIEVMPLTEFPFDGSWGYQPISLFAPTSRYGSPDDCRAFIDACHRAGLGLWLDWVPGHFPSDAHGLGRFDGTALYEHADPRQGLHRDCNTLIYNYGRREVANFLLSSALYWLREHHIDGIRVDAVASMLYLDYSRNEGEWIPNMFGGRENLDAINFIGRMPGDQWQRFANLRAYFAFMWTHPGKKLLFMGGEFAQNREWNHDFGLDWHLLSDPLHLGVQTLVRDLNRLYRATPALHQLDCDPEGFAWIDAANGNESVLSYLRRSPNPQELSVIVCNFTPVPRHDYRIGVPRPGRYLERMNTDAQIYGGSGVGNAGGVEADAHPMHGHAHSLCLQLPPLGAVIFTVEP